MKAASEDGPSTEEHAFAIDPLIAVTQCTNEDLRPPDALSHGATRGRGGAIRCIDSAYGMLTVKGWLTHWQRKKPRYPAGITGLFWLRG